MATAPPVWPLNGAPLNGRPHVARAVSLASMIQGSGQQSAVLVTTVPLAAGFSGGGNTTGALSEAIPLASALGGTGSLRAGLATGNALACAWSGSGNATGSLDCSAPLAAALMADALVQAGLITLAPIQVGMTADTLLGAEVSAGMPLAARLGADGASHMGLSTTIRMMATASAQGLLHPAIVERIPLAAALLGGSQFSGLLVVLNPFRVTFGGDGCMAASIRTQAGPAAISSGSYDGCCFNGCSYNAEPDQPPHLPSPARTLTVAFEQRFPFVLQENRFAGAPVETTCEVEP